MLPICSVLHYLCWGLFSNIEFLRLVDKINTSIGQDPNAASLIGVLDIYGFESFKINRLELNRKLILYF